VTPRDVLPLMSADPPAAAVPAAPAQRLRPLFRRYLVLILTGDGRPAASGAISIYFRIRRTVPRWRPAAQRSPQHAIEQYIRQIDQQLAYAALPQLDAGDVELRAPQFPSFSGGHPRSPTSRKSTRAVASRSPCRGSGWTSRGRARTVAGAGVSQRKAR
jgi:hypothetical protein